MDLWTYGPMDQIANNPSYMPGIQVYWINFTRPLPKERIVGRWGSSRALYHLPGICHRPTAGTALTTVDIWLPVNRRAQCVGVCS